LNWYAHAVVAEARSGEPLCVLGAMLPDFASVLRLHAIPPREGPLADGMRLHAETDARFHAAPEFVALQSQGRAHLEIAGLSRGSARGAAHVGIELALDGWLARQRPRSPLFAAALAEATLLADPAALFRGSFDPERWRALCDRLASGELPEAYALPERSAVGVERTLAPHARLALAPGAREAVASWLRGFGPKVAAAAPALLARCGA
jgi:hypothetical protein